MQFEKRCSRGFGTCGLEVGAVQLAAWEALQRGFKALRLVYNQIYVYNYVFIHVFVYMYISMYVCID